MAENLPDTYIVLSNHTTDYEPVQVAEMLRMVRQGKNVCMFAEDARTWHGVTAPILPFSGIVAGKYGGKET